MLRSALVVVLALALSLAGADASARYRDWRDAVKAGDFPAAYEDLFQTWRNGTPEPRAQALRNAWRNPQIVAVARADFQRILKPVVDSHSGDLASLRKAVRKGPMEDRVDFAAVVDRKLDVDREIALAFEARGAPKVAAPAATAAVSPALLAPAKPVEPAPVKSPSALQPLASASSAAPVAAAPVAAPVPAAPGAPAPSPTPSPWSSYLPGVDPGAVDRATRSDLPPEVAAAKAKSVWRCRGPAECDRAWAAAENFVTRHADMRLRTAKRPLIETYPPIVPGEIGLRVDRIDVSGDEAELRLTVSCRAAKLRQACTTAELRLYPAFPAFLRSSR